MSIEVYRVQSGPDFSRFIQFPYGLHAQNDLWVPPLRMEIKKTLGRKNPFWKHAERALYLAVRDGETVGRIAAIVDFNHIRFHDEMVGFWGFFEAIDDQDVALRLFEATENFLSRRGISVSRGPVNPSTNEECGLLVDGFDTLPRIMMPHNPAYYRNLVEQAGYSKVKDLYAYWSDVTEKPLQRLARLTQRVRKREQELRVRPVRLSRFTSELKAVREIYNSAWERNWGFVPMTGEEIEFLAGRLKPLVVPEVLRLAFLKEEPAGFLMALPDYNQALNGLNGKLTPLNLLRIYVRSRKIDTLRLITMGIKADYRNRGFDAILYHDCIRAGLDLGYRHCEYSWVLEDNYPIQKAVSMMGGERYKTYRIYERVLRDAA